MKRLTPLEESHSAAWLLGCIFGIFAMEFGWVVGIILGVVGLALRIVIENWATRAHRRAVLDAWFMDGAS